MLIGGMLSSKMGRIQGEAVKPRVGALNQLRLKPTVASCYWCADEITVALGRIIQSVSTQTARDVEEVDWRSTFVGRYLKQTTGNETFPRGSTWISHWSYGHFPALFVLSAWYSATQTKTKTGRARGSSPHWCWKSSAFTMFYPSRGLVV